MTIHVKSRAIGALTKTSRDGCRHFSPQSTLKNEAGSWPIQLAEWAELELMLRQSSASQDGQTPGFDCR